MGYLDSGHGGSSWDMALELSIYSTHYMIPQCLTPSYEDACKVIHERSSSYVPWMAW